MESHAWVSVCMSLCPHVDVFALVNHAMVLAWGPGKNGTLYLKESRLVREILRKDRGKEEKRNGKTGLAWGSSL